MRAFINIPFVNTSSQLEIAQFSFFAKNQTKKGLRAVAERFLDRLGVPREYCGGVSFVGLAETTHPEGVFFPFAREAGIAKKVSYVYEGFCLEKNEPVQKTGWRYDESCLEDLPREHALNPVNLFGGDHVWRTMLRRAKLFGLG
jgi:hypothetical protein